MGLVLQSQLIATEKFHGYLRSLKKMAFVDVSGGNEFHKQIARSFQPPGFTRPSAMLGGPITCQLIPLPALHATRMSAFLLRKGC